MALRANRRICTTSLLGCSLGALILAAAPAAAQDAAAPVDQASSQDDGEIVVTAQRRSERSVDVPITITSVSAEQLESAGANQLSDIARIAPALRFDSAATWVQPTIRGVGTAVATSGGGGNVGIYVDGFYSPNPLAADFQLMKLESVQVLKGPQGTLFGRNTTGGAILVSTAEPSTTTSAAFRTSFGSFNTIRSQGYVTTGITDNLAIDLEGMYAHGNGFVKNITTGSERDGQYRNWSLRGGLKANLGENVEVVLRYTHSDTNDPTLMNTNIYTDPTFGVGTNFPSSLYTTDPDQVATSGPTEFYSNADIYQGTIRADLGFANLTSYTQFRNEDSLLVEDLDHTAAQVFLLQVGVEDRTFSQELLLTSKPGGPLQWTAGLFYFNNKDTWRTYIGTPLPTDRLARTSLGGSSSTTRSYAAFADATYEITPKLFLTGGLRFSHDEVINAYYTEPVFINPSLTRTFVPDLKGDKLTPRVVLRYKPDQSSSIYASYSKGYKAGILDVGGNTGDVVNPEDINAFEVGYKYDDRRFSASLSAYYYDYKDLQVSLYITRSGSPSAAIINAASSEIYGLEGQFSYKLTDRFTLSAGGAYTHGRYKTFYNAPVYTRCGTAGVVCGPGQSFAVVPTLLTDVPMQRTPELTGNVSARYSADLAGGKFGLSGNLYYTSKIMFGPSGTQFPQKGYEVLSLRAEWTDPSDVFTLAVYGDNLTGQRYRTQVQYNLYGVGSVWSAPATWGAQIGFRF